MRKLLRVIKEILRPVCSTQQSPKYLGTEIKATPATPKCSSWDVTTNFVDGEPMWD